MIAEMRNGGEVSTDANKKVRDPKGPGPFGSRTFHVADLPAPSRTV
jgi:hypothetical protein